MEGKRFRFSSKFESEMLKQFGHSLEVPLSSNRIGDCSPFVVYPLSLSLVDTLSSASSRH